LKEDIRLLENVSLSEEEALRVHFLGRETAFVLNKKSCGTTREKISEKARWNQTGEKRQSRLPAPKREKKNNGVHSLPSENTDAGATAKP